MIASISRSLNSFLKADGRVTAAPSRGGTLMYSLGGSGALRMGDVCAVAAAAAGGGGEEEFATECVYSAACPAGNKLITSP